MNKKIILILVILIIPNTYALIAARKQCNSVMMIVQASLYGRPNPANPKGMARAPGRELALALSGWGGCPGQAPCPVLQGS